ncbi:MAG: hypothetical protein ABIR30_05560 [Chitinophagaceae bacterium]
MKRVLLLCLLSGLSTACFSQTKKIAHRSHSGSNSSFTLAGPDNFGETPEMIAERNKKTAIEKAKADSIAKKAVADSIAKKAVADSLGRLKVKPKKIKATQVSG